MEERGRREIGKVIKMVLKNRGISLVEGAKKLGISKQLMNYTLNEKEDKNWDEWEIKKWCEVLKIREEEIRKRVNI